MGERSIDLELVKRVQRGDKAAFDLLVRKYQHKVANLISRYIHDAAEVQDVSQEAFIKAYRGLAKFRGDSAFYTWLYRIAVNTAKNYLVSQGRRTPDYAVDAQDAEQYESGSALREYGNPERQLLMNELRGVVNDTIEQLPDELRTAITLRELEGMSYEEIASVMECPIGTIRSRIFRAREAIDAAIGPLLDETSDEESGHERRRF
jgi:RNA polymerase sigma-70 factor (ECF subfamily)